MEELNTKQELDEQELEQESENDSHTETPREEKKPEVFENTEHFLYKDGQGRELILNSANFNVADLCGIGADFLGLSSPKSTKSKPSYT